MTQRRSRPSRRLRRLTHAVTLVNTTALRITRAFGCRVFDCSLGAGGHLKGLRHLRPSASVVDRCCGSVEGAVDSALSSVYERVRKSIARGQGGVCELAHGGGTFKLASEGKGRPLTHVRTSERVVHLLLAHSRGLQDGVRGRTARSPLPERLGGIVQHTTEVFCDGDRTAGR